MRMGEKVGKEEKREGEEKRKTGRERKTPGLENNRVIHTAKRLVDSCLWTKEIGSQGDRTYTFSKQNII